MKRSLFALGILMVLVAHGALAQGTYPSAPERQQPVAEPPPVPILTGYSGFVADFQPGNQVLRPTIAPIMLVPLGRRLLIEAEGEFEGEYTKTTDQPWEREWEKGVEYLQADILLNRYVTLVAGRFLTPFGIFNERLHPSWIKNLQAMPLIMPVGTGSSNGAMLRGGFSLSPSVNLNYSTYFSATSTTRAFEATRAAGTRVSLFFPSQRLEIGGSFQRQLQDEHVNSFGLDFTWQLKPIPLDLRGEYARNRLMGSGYWVEAAYLTRRFPGRLFRNSQAVVRMEQFLTADMMMSSGALAAVGHDELPDVNTQRFMFGWNYYFNDALKLSGAYGRSFSTDGDHNIWSVGLAYRWFFGLAGRRTQ